MGKSKKEGGGSSWGKGKTDPDSWFKPGCKPGPGRPKGSKNHQTVWQEANALKVKVPINGKQVSLSKGQMKYHQLSNKAAGGDMKAISKAIELDEKWSSVDLAPPTPQEHQADLVTLDAFIALRQKFGPTPGGAA